MPRDFRSRDSLAITNEPSNELNFILLFVLPCYFHSNLSECEILPCTGVGRIDSQRVAELLGRFFIFSHLKKDSPEIVMCIGIGRVETHGLFQFLCCFGKPMRFSHDSGEIGVSAWLVGLDCEKTTILVDRLVGPPL